MISFLVFSAGMARDILLKKPVPAKPWKKLISAEKDIYLSTIHSLAVNCDLMIIMRSSSFFRHLTKSTPLDEGVCLEDIASRAESFSGADLESLGRISKLPSLFDTFVHIFIALISESVLLCPFFTHLGWGM